MIKAVSVDVDDTLCQTEASAFELENTVLERMGRAPMSRAVHKETWGKSIDDAIVLRSPGVDLAAFRQSYNQVCAEFVRDGKIDVIAPANYLALDKLILEGKQVMLLTSRDHAELEHMLAPDHLLATRVTAFYYKDITGHLKPDPRVFDKLLQTHDLLPSECIYVGDSPSDAQASNKAGLHFIASLESGLRAEQDFADFTVDAFIHAFSDLDEAVATVASNASSAPIVA
jgi:phosphoglycolate phosphatase